MDVTPGHIFLPRNDDSGASRGHQALVVTGVLTGLAIFIVAMRLYARIGLMKLMGREDWTILAALACSVVYLGFVSSQVHYGLGKHDADLSPDTLKQQLKHLWVAIPFYNASLALSKLSALFQYLRIFPNPRFRLACYIVMGIVATYGTWAVVSGFVNCVPVAKFWDRTIAGSCLSFEAVWFFNASMNISTDLTLLIMPMPLLSHLQLPRKQKIALMAVFAIGVVVVVTSILRLFSLWQLTQSPDTSWSNVGAAYWTAAECNVAIICACLPLLRPLVSCILPKALSTNSYNHYPHNRTLTGGTRSRYKSQLYSQDREYGMHPINESGEPKIGDIAVITEMIQETSTKNDESASQRRLVMVS